MDGVRRDKPQDILHKCLTECHAAGELNPDGKVPSELVFRRFQAELFNQYRKDVRLREFQALMQRSPLLVEAVQSEYRIDLRKLLGVKEEEECESVKSYRSGSAKVEVEVSRKPNKNLLYVILKYVTTVARPVKADFEFTDKSCLLCRLSFGSGLGLRLHMKKHESLPDIEPGGSLQTAKSQLNVSFRYNPNQLTSALQIKNRQPGPMLLGSIFVYHTSTLLFPVHTKQLEMLDSNGVRSFSLPNHIFVRSYDKFWLLVCCRKANEQTEFIEHYQLNVRTVSPPLRPGMLDEYFPKPELTSLISNNLQMSKEQTLSEHVLLDAIRYLCTTEPGTRLTIANYCDMLEVMVHVHDLNVQLDLAKYQADQAIIVPTEVDCQYRIDVAHFNALPTNLAAGDIINLTLVDPNMVNVEIRGTVVQVLPEHLVVELEKKVEANCSCQVRLQVDRLVCRLELQALDMVRRDQLAPLFFPQEAPEPKTIGEIKSWFNLGLEGNVEQQTAVRNIANRTSYPLPYILFGPPGTGKTTTLVEAIVQICTRHPSEHILVTAQSNAACDELAVRLLNYLPSKHLLRFFSRSAEKRIDELSEPLKQISNLSTGSYQWPTWEQLEQTNVLICSLTTCGRLVQCRVRPNHFKHVFIDECGSASEPAALVAMAGLVSTHKKLWASVVLAGDPHQLGPVVRSELADKMGLGMSMLERLMNLPVYQKDPQTHKYNPLIITKLLKNFRSHEALLRFSNQRFYDSELIALAPPEEVTFVENWKFLPNKNLPIILHTVLGENESNFGRSRMNSKEVEIVEFYLDFILRSGINGRAISQHDIGIISPYQLQVQQLRQLCERHNWSSVEVGSVEQYQGREKLIMLLSTVRSHTADVGFLNNVKRLNVAMTRAKALLVVIGNSFTLQHDANWFELVRYCKENGAVVGKGFGLDAKRIVERTKRERMFDALFAKDAGKAKEETKADS